MTKKKDDSIPLPPRTTEDEHTSILQVQDLIAPGDEETGARRMHPSGDPGGERDTQVSRLESLISKTQGRPERSRMPMHTGSLDGDRVLAGATAVIRLADIEARSRQQATQKPADVVVPNPVVPRPAPPPPVPDVARGREETGPLTELESVAVVPSPTGTVSAGAGSQNGPRKIAFFGPKGGVGATAISANVAGVLSRLGGRSVIVDMDLQLGAVPVSLGVTPQRSISELVLAAEDPQTGIRGESLDHHDSGVAVVSQPHIDDLDKITAQRVPRFFECLADEFDYVVIDGLRDFSDLAMVCLDSSDLIVVVFTQDVPAVRAVIRSLELFNKLGYPSAQIRLVLNRYQKKSLVSLEAISRALGREVDAVVHNNFPLIERGFNQGRFIYELEPGSPIAQDLETLARGISGLPPVVQKKSLLAKIFRR